jgi:hypothetical protein
MVLVALEVELAGTARRPLRLHLSRDVGLAWLAGYSPPLPETSFSQPRVRLRDLIGINPRHEHSAVVLSSIQPIKTSSMRIRVDIRVARGREPLTSVTLAIGLLHLHRQWPQARQFIKRERQG